MRDADSQGQKQPKKNIDPKAAVDVEKRGYARPTHTSRQRVKCRPKEKENFMPYIPCGAKVRAWGNTSGCSLLKFNQRLISCLNMC